MVGAVMLHVGAPRRRVASLQNRLLVTAAEVQRIGRPRLGSVPWSDLEAELSP